MKKRILSCLMALALCLTLLPTAALAEETEGTAQTSPAMEEAADPANGEAKQENQPAEVKQESQPAEQEEQQEDSAAKQAVAAVQAMIDALPDAADLDGMDDAEAMEVYEAFQTACEAYYETLNDEQREQLKNTEKLEALSERFSQLETLAAGDTHTHGVCGKSGCAEDGHDDIDFNKWLASRVDYALEVGEGDAAEGKGQTPNSNSKYVLKSGNYYLKTGKDVTIKYPILITGDVTICLNGQTIESTAEDQPVFEVVSGTLTLTDCGSTGKVTSAYRGGGVEVNGGTFNLYGGSITKNKAAKGGGVYMTSGTVNVYGGAIADNKAAGSAEGTGNGGGVYMSGGTFHMRGGSITDNTTEVYGNGEGNGGGVYVSGGTFNLYNGGSITNNKAINYVGQNRGGGVHVGSYDKAGTFNLYGGEISNNEAEDGGGVYVYDGTFTMRGGKITGNTATSLGGGVCVYNGTFTMSDGEISGNNEASSGGVSVDIGTFNMSGGKITGNTATKYGGGVHMTRGTYGTLNVSGTAVIKDNQKGTDANNVHLFNDKFITVGGTLDGGASIGVTTEKTPDAGGTIPIATGTGLTPADAAKFQSDLDGYAVSVNDAKNKLVLVKAHTHCICGNSSCNEDGHGEAVTFATVLTQALLEQNSYTLSGGTYYLNGTLSPVNKIEITGTVTICLNGQTIQSTAADQSVFEIADGGTLTLTDCTSNPGTVTHSNGTGSGVYVLGGGTFDLYGGKITGNTVTNEGGGVCVAATGEFNMHGGEISVNTATNYGGGVYVRDGGKFTMNGGAKISGNTAAYGGGVHVDTTGEFNMRGGSITNNKANKSEKNSMGGGVYVHGTFNMSGGAKISGNTAPSNGGGVYVGGSGSTFTMNGNASITDNTAKNGGGVGVYSGATFEMNGNASITDNKATTGNGGGVYVGGGVFTMSGGSITSNHTANDTYGGGVYVDTHGTFNMSGGTIGGAAADKANKAKNGGGGVYVSGGTFNMSGGSITGNDSNGVFVDDRATFTVSGAATVKGNTREGAASNVFLTWGAKITIGPGGLNCDDGSIGVTKGAGRADDAIATGAPGVTLSDEIAKKFKIDDSTYVVKYKDKQLVLAKKDTTAETHTHCLCGKTHTAIGDHKTDTQITFATKLWMDNGVLKKGNGDWTKGTVNRADGGAVSHEGYVLTTGNYYLDDNLTLSGAAILIDGDVKLCLNGHTIDRANGNAPSDYVIWVLGQNQAHLTLTDCMGGGTIKGGGNGGVDIFGFCTLDMFGGTITGNTNRGVGVGQFGTFNLYGGKITGNSAGYGGGVYNGGTVNMYGGEISDNTASNKGGGVYMEASVGNYQGGILNVSGAAKITDNTVKGVANNVYLPSGKTITIGEGGLSGKIGVTTETKPAAGTPVTVIAATKGTSGLTTHVVSDDNAYATAVEGSALVLKVKGDGGGTPAEKPEPQYSAPTPRARLTYTGAPQVLINKGSVEGGVMQYRLDNGAYSPDLPTATNAGIYTVYYKVVGDASHNDVAEQSLKVWIEKAKLSGTPTFTKVTGAGKTLKDVTFTKADGWPDGEFEWGNGVLGYLEDKPLVQGKAYSWLYLADNYYAEGTVVLWADTSSSGSSSSGGGGGSRPSTNPVQTEVSKDPDGSVSLSKTSAAKGDKVTITVKPERHYEVDEVIVRDSKGKQLAVKDNGDGTFTFEMPADKVTVEPTFSWVNPFADVANSAYYVDAVEWMLKREVTQGTTETTFSPNLNCTRAQIVTFLWRAAGSPEPKGTADFADVPAGSYYAKAVAWAIENGITGGTGNGLFSPDAACTRAQSAAFLYRAAGSPAVNGSAGFSDVAADAYYAQAVAWAKEHGITDGIGGGLFGSANDCTRAQIAAFLWRLYAEK